MPKTNHFRIGIFLIASLTLLLIMLYSLGLSDLFIRKAEITTFFSESVQGLSNGAQVKYKGALIGNVENIYIHPEKKIIQVDMSINLDCFRDSSSKNPFADDDDFYRFLQKEISGGLRCRLEYAGITGLRYIDMDYFAAPGEQREPPKLRIGYFLMPSAPSAFRDIAKSINTSLERISKIRFEEISDNLVRNMDEMNKILSSPEIRNTLAKVSSAADKIDSTTAAISNVLTEDQVRTLVAQIDKTLAELRTLSETIRTEAEKSDFPGTAASLRNAAGMTAEVLKQRSLDVKEAVDAWVRTLSVLRELTENLNKDPASVIRGRK